MLRDTWAKTVSPNKNVKIYIGAPASSTAAGSGYVDASTLSSIVQQTRSQYSSFGGVMLWDASQAYGMILMMRLGCQFSSAHDVFHSEQSLRRCGQKYFDKWWWSRNSHL